MNRKKSPVGYYTASEAREKLGLAKSTFAQYVQQRKIPKYVPELRTEGFYEKKEIDRLAQALVPLLAKSEEDRIPPECEVRFAATQDDIRGIIALIELLGWGNSVSPEERLAHREALYAVNPYLDLIVIVRKRVVGYLTAMPWNERAMDRVMRDNRQLLPATDLLPYTEGGTYDIYMGEVVDQTVINHKVYAALLIRGFSQFIATLVAKDITVKRLLALRSQVQEGSLVERVGFLEQPAEEGDRLPRYILDVETSNSDFARRYRQAKERGTQLRTHLRESGLSTVVTEATTDADKQMLRAAGFLSIDGITYHWKPDQPIGHVVL